MLYHSSSYSDVGDPQHLRESLLDLYEDMDHQTPEDKVYDGSHRVPFKGSTVRKHDEEKKIFRERISRESVHHLRGLVGHRNPHLVSILKVDCISPEGSLGNLKEYVLDRWCEQKDIVTYLSQVASALHYLHINHIVHGDLRAEYVNVESKYKVPKVSDIVISRGNYVIIAKRWPFFIYHLGFLDFPKTSESQENFHDQKVQVGRLGLSKPLSRSSREVTSKSCVVSAAMPPDSTRWSAPEVILDGHYTHASDVWSFAILAWELYESLACGQENRMCSIPYFELKEDEILPCMRDGRPLSKPKGCPDWMYIIMHQCWTHDSVQRPSVLAIFDCLTSRKPMESWIMQLWLRNHDRSAWPDLSVRQTEDASHILDAKMHPLEEQIRQMTPDGFFAQHSYHYVDPSSAVVEDPACSLEFDAVNEEGDTSDRQNGITEEIHESCTSLYSSYGSIEHDNQCIDPSSADVEDQMHEQEFCEVRQINDDDDDDDDMDDQLGGNKHSLYEEVVRETRV